MWLCHIPAYAFQEKMVPLPLATGQRLCYHFHMVFSFGKGELPYHACI